MYYISDIIYCHSSNLCVLSVQACVQAFEVMHARFCFVHSQNIVIHHCVRSDTRTRALMVEAKAGKSKRDTGWTNLR